ncbi:MAG: YkgJ family cysteine cluster protein [Thermodesulfovibrionales bacterium]
MGDDLNDAEDGQDNLQISDLERQRIVSILNKMLEMGISAIYGQEEEGLPDAVIDCRSKIQECRAACCTLTFALTRDETQKSIIRHNPEKPFFISRNTDGYCTHLDRGSMECTVWNDRPLRCRRYDCTEDRPEDS